ncbi:hypothetical protein [Mycobacterium sp. RTGN5]|uniref:hypothetical protein n=1 Tax=Mycobacterium sp. RTGN5 TaxID=3016522 RepID=UPI0029C65A56|nr:hypothetical protein [Mycobacterium sp. RTGN5]
MGIIHDSDAVVVDGAGVNDPDGAGADVEATGTVVVSRTVTVLGLEVGVGVGLEHALANADPLPTRRTTPAMKSLVLECAVIYRRPPAGLTLIKGDLSKFIATAQAKRPCSGGGSLPGRKLCRLGPFRQ